MSTATIWSVLNNTLENNDIKRGIEIPMIQRDYAQGRENNKAGEIRKVFLNKILKTVKDVIEKDEHPLELDFVYGFLEASAFIPLDGQQRLTTLYLLHWYFAFKEQKLDNFQAPFSRFNYQTRQSSSEFFKKMNKDLTEEDHQAIFKNGSSFKSVITNQNWYFLGWKHDLTIQSVITMLDETHSIFSDSQITFSDLISEEKPPIIFNFLNVENFGLTDDLYIKMNARGKPLTNFENLKAELGKFIEQSDFNTNYSYCLTHSTGTKNVDVETYFVTKVDTSWSDYFWKIRDIWTNEFDDKLLNTLGFIALNELAKQDIKSFESSIRVLENDFSELSYYKLNNLGLLNEASIISYINTLDLLVSNDEVVKSYLKDESYFNKKGIVSVSYGKITNASYPERALFYAVFSFLIVHQDKVSLEELKRWDRLIWNLVNNTTYNTPRELHNSLVSIGELIESYTGDIYQTFINSEIKGFDNQQIIEEKIKIQLLLKDNKWDRFVHQAEDHKYLNGQIVFLLAFSGIYDRYLSEGLIWGVEEDTAYFKNVNSYFDKFTQLFTSNGLRNFENEVFRRALLVKGDYMLFSTNWSFLIDNHRDISWKRLLKETGNRSSDYFQKRCGYLKELLDSVDVENVEGSLKRTIAESSCKDWRRDFIKHPILINTSYNKFLKVFDNGNMYVLRKKKYNKYADPEAKSILLKEALKKQGFSDGEIELGFIDELNQYGIIRIKKFKPKVVYNLNSNGKFLIRQRSKEDFITGSLKSMEKYIVDNFLN